MKQLRGLQVIWFLLIFGKLELNLFRDNSMCKWKVLPRPGPWKLQPMDQICPVTCFCELRMIFYRLDSLCSKWLFKYPHNSLSYAGKDWGQEEKGTTEDEMVGWHHWLNGHGFGWTLGVGDGQGGLTCCSSRGRKESEMTERLNWTELNLKCWLSGPLEKKFAKP